MTTLLKMDRTAQGMGILAWLLGAAHIVFGATKLAALPPLVEQFQAWQLRRG